MYYAMHWKHRQMQGGAPCHFLAGRCEGLTPEESEGTVEADQILSEEVMCWNESLCNRVHQHMLYCFSTVLALSISPYEGATPMSSGQQQTHSQDRTGCPQMLLSDVWMLEDYGRPGHSSQSIAKI